MSCRRSLEIELSDFLAKPWDSAFQAFRDHYPRCPDCAADVRIWTELHQWLVAESDDLHPDPELLARYDERPNEVPGEERRQLQSHLAGCRACRDELAGLASFSPAAIATAESPAASGRWVRDISARLWRGVLHPAFAYVLVGLLLIPLVRQSVDSDSNPLLGVAPNRRGAPSAATVAGESSGAPSPVVEAEETERFAEALGSQFAVKESGDRVTGGSVNAAAESPGESQLGERSDGFQRDRGADPTQMRNRAQPADPTGWADRSQRAEEIRSAAQIRSAAKARTVGRAVPARPNTGSGIVDESAPSAELAAASALVPRGSPRPVALLGDRPTLVVADESQAWELRVPVPIAVSGVSDFEIRIVDGSRGRELRERRSRVEHRDAVSDLYEPGLQAVPSLRSPGSRQGADSLMGWAKTEILEPLRLRVPGDWLAPGLYRVELRTLDEEVVATYALVVESP